MIRLIHVLCALYWLTALVLFVTNTVRDDVVSTLAMLVCTILFAVLALENRR